MFCPPLLWHHLAYAYVLESTGIVEIFAELVRRLVVGETLGVLTPDSIAWLRATEQLFFRRVVGAVLHPRYVSAPMSRQGLDNVTNRARVAFRRTKVPCPRVSLNIFGKRLSELHVSGEAITWEQAISVPAIVHPNDLIHCVERLAKAVQAEVGEHGKLCN